MKNIKIGALVSTFNFTAQTTGGELAPNFIRFRVENGQLVEGELPNPTEGVTYIVSAIVFNILKKTRKDVCMWDPDGKNDGVYSSVILNDGSIATIIE